MKTLVGGAAAAVLGLIGLVVWWAPFMTLLAGAIPLMLLTFGHPGLNSRIIHSLNGHTIRDTR